MNSHRVTLFSRDLTNAVDALLNEIKPRIVPYLPPRAPVGPEQINFMGGDSMRTYDIVRHVAPIWRGGEVRVVVTDDLIVVEARTGDGFAEVAQRRARSDTAASPRAANPARRVNRWQGGRQSRKNSGRHMRHRSTMMSRSSTRGASAVR